MRRTWQWFPVSALLVAALAAAPVRAGGGKSSDDPKTVAQKLEEIKTALEPLGGMRTSVANLDGRLQALEQAVQRELKDVRGWATDTTARITQAQTDINELRRQLAQVRQDLDNLARGSSPTRISAYAGPAGSAPATARVRLVNTYGLPVQAVVNGMLYDVAPGQQRYVDPLPAGPFSYEVLGIQPRRDLTLAPGETFTVTVYPR